MGLDCRCSCGLARLHVLLVPRAGLTYQGMRWDTAGGEQEANTETTRKDGLSLQGLFFSLHNLAIRAKKAKLKINISKLYYI